MTRAGAFAAVLWLAAAAPGLSRAAPVATGGAGLIRALESATSVLVGTIEAPSRIDLHGYSAVLVVERDLRGRVARGAKQRIAWEELAAERQPRFASGDRVLVALTPLPDGSLWTRRFPEPGSRATVRALGAAGNAFLRRPSPAAVNILDHYLRLDAAERHSAAGVAYLAQLVGGAEVTLSLAAALRLADYTELDPLLDPVSASALVRGLLRPDASEALAAAILDLIAVRKLESLRAELESLAGAQPLAPAAVFLALGRLNGQLSPAHTALLLEAPLAHRRVVARYADGPDAPAQLSALMYGDPDAEVRAAAVARLTALRGVAAEDAVIRLFSDHDRSVRVAAARALGRLGADGVPALRAIAASSSRDAARAAVAGLVAAGAHGQDALLEIARTHPDEGTRTLARVALGGALDDHRRR